LLSLFHRCHVLQAHLWDSSISWGSCQDMGGTTTTPPKVSHQSLYFQPNSTLTPTLLFDMKPYPCFSGFYPGNLTFDWKNNKNTHLVLDTRPSPTWKIRLINLTPPYKVTWRSHAHHFLIMAPYMPIYTNK